MSAFGTHLLARLRRDGCIFSKADRECTAREMRNGLLLCNFVAWLLIIVAVRLLV